MRRRRAWLGVAAAVVLPALAGCAHATGVPDPAPALRVMSFNIRYGTAPDGEHAWALRRDLVVRVIREFDPAVLGLQEALRFQLDELRTALPRYGELGVGRDDGREAGEYAAILYDQLRLQVLEQGSFWLSDTPAQPGSMTWGNRIPRMVTWARFADRAGGGTFYAYNTHWDHESQAARERSARLLLARIAARAAAADPVVVTGDFNAAEDNPAFRALLAPLPGAEEAALRDTFRALHPDASAVGTFHGFRGGDEGDKIDAVLASPGWSVRAAGIVRLAEGSRHPSDHHPVTAMVTRER